MQKLIMASLGVASLLCGCATLEHRTVGKKLSREFAYVYLGAEDGIAPGDRVELFMRHCDHDLVRHDVICTEDRVGHGTVTQIFDGASSLVRVDPGVDFGAGTLVRPEKIFSH